MPTVVTVELDPEYVKWPTACACCNGMDERDMEVAVGSTSPDEPDHIMECRVPYCLECYEHNNRRVGWWKIVALFLVLTMIVAFSPIGSSKLLPAFAAAEALLVGGYIAWTLNGVKRSMKRSCAGLNGVVRFVEPTTSTMTTVVFKNEFYAIRFKELNRFSIVEQ
jgi:hypothetical protein